MARSQPRPQMSSEHRATPATHPRPADPGPYCSALAWVGKSPRRHPLVPYIALRYLGYFVLALVLGLALTEGVLRYLASQRTLVSVDWVAENAAINHMNSDKVLASAEDPVWNSRGIPLTSRRAGVSRILVLGDSFVWGDGYLNANDIWWRQLQREFQRRGYLGVEVVAAGLNGASTQQQLEWLRTGDLVDRVQPDAIVLGYVTNDPDVRRADGSYLVRQIGRDLPLPTWAGLEATLGRVAPTLTAQIKPLLTQKWASAVEGAYSYRDWEREILRSPNIDAYREVVLSLGDTVRGIGLPFLVVSLPGVPSKSLFAPLLDPIEPLFAEAEIHFVNLLDDFIAAYPEGTAPGVTSLLHWGINPANGHPGGTATRFYARAVADLIEGQNLGLLGPRSTQPPELAPRINDWMPPSIGVEPLSSTQWRFSYPAPHELAPREPLGERHLMLAFELPVGIRSVGLAGERLRAARLWFTGVDADSGVDLGDPRGGESREGARLHWDLGSIPGSGAVNTLRLTADLGEPLIGRRFAPDTQTIRHWGGRAYAFPAAELRAESDDDDHAERSTWALLEDGSPLQGAHAPHAAIVAQGAGLWSHWKDVVVFSASDNSDPRTNGRHYQLVQYDTQGNGLELEIDFAEPAVRP